MDWSNKDIGYIQAKILEILTNNKTSEKSELVSHKYFFNYDTWDITNQIDTLQRSGFIEYTEPLQYNQETLRPIKRTVFIYQLTKKGQRYVSYLLEQQSAHKFQLQKTALQQPSISDDDFKNIINIINNCATSMETTPTSFYQLGEEALRDIFLSTLNTHYQATGETFRKKGKTDIHILFESKAAYVGECKIWHGKKLFDEAVSQLKSYTTWKDTKVSIIIFNKENANFAAVLHAINDWVKTNTSKLLPQQAENICISTLIDKDTSQEYQLHIAVYDLYIAPKKR